MKLHFCGIVSTLTLYYLSRVIGRSFSGCEAKWGYFFVGEFWFKLLIFLNILTLFCGTRNRRRRQSYKIIKSNFQKRRKLKSISESLFKTHHHHWRYSPKTGLTQQSTLSHDNSSKSTFQGKLF